MSICLAISMPWSQVIERISVGGRSLSAAIIAAIRADFVPDPGALCRALLEQAERALGA